VDEFGALDKHAGSDLTGNIMAIPSPRHIIQGSQREPLAGATAVGPIQPDERIEVTLRVRAKAASGPTARSLQADTAPQQRTYLTREQYAASHGADPADLAKVA